MKLAELLKQRGFEIDYIGSPQAGYRNISYPIFLKNHQVINFVVYKNEINIEKTICNANKFGNFLAENGLPARRSILQNLIIIKNPKTESRRFACIYNYLPGYTIPWESYTSKHIKLLGEMMGKMHLISESYSSSIKEFPLAIEIQRSNLTEMQKYFTDLNVILAIKKKLNLQLRIQWDYLFKILDSFDNEKKQLLHMDFVRGNILFINENSNLKISGILDFEKVSYGPKIFDLARTLAFLLVDCKYILPHKIYKYFLFNGYRRRGQNTLPNLKLLKILVHYFLIYDFYKFLKHNPYEYLKQNEHYTRTEKILLYYKYLKNFN